MKYFDQIIIINLILINYIPYNVVQSKKNFNTILSKVIEKKLIENKLQLITVIKESNLTASCLQGLYEMNNEIAIQKNHSISDLNDQKRFDLSLLNIDLLLNEKSCDDLVYGRFCNVSAIMIIKGPNNVHRTVDISFQVCFPILCGVEEIKEKAQFLLDIIKNDINVTSTVCKSKGTSEIVSEKEIPSDDIDQVINNRKIRQSYGSEYENDFVIAPMPDANQDQLATLTIPFTHGVNIRYWPTPYEVRG